MNEAVNEAYEKFRGDDGGKNADYIPFLANVPLQLFGISVCLPDGEIVEAGDTDYVFGVESVSKVPTAILAMEQYGPDTVLDQIGADATGLPFNSIMAILLENDHPSTPLVNAGAIAACSMVKPVGDASGKWKAITDFLEKLCGSPLVLQDELYKSESETNFNNRSIAWLLKNYDRIYDDPDMSLDIYTRQCSMGVTARQLSICGGTIANRGVNPVTHERVFDAAITPKIVSMIATVGFYEHTGDWIFSSGIPAKTGVGGGIVGVLPGVMGIAAFSPKLDGSGNSARTDLIATSGAGYFTYRTPQYKLIFNAGNGSGDEYRIDGQPPLQFYDMVSDPEEKVNRIDDPEYAGRIREMAARVKKYIEDGRSTPGAKAANDGGNSWKQITDIMSGLYAGNR